MTKKLAILTLTLITLPSFSETWVNGYYRKNGTYVPGHHRSDPDGDKRNNWSTEGNQNPYTGEWGKKKLKSDDRNQYRTPNLFGNSQNDSDSDD